MKTNPRLEALRATPSAIACAKDKFREYVRILREATLYRNKDTKAMEKRNA